jgi:uncharacterized protein YkwD
MSAIEKGMVEEMTKIRANPQYLIPHL